MLVKNLILLGLSSLALAASGLSQVKTSSLDPSSYANLDSMQTVHFDLDITVDFPSRIIYGTQKLQIKPVADSSEVVLDIQGILI